MIGPIPLALFLGAWAAHPLHTTHTAIDEREKGEVRIEIRAFIDDLRAAVEQREHAFNDSTIARYVRSVVELMGVDGRSSMLVWDSRVPDGDVTRLRFVARVPGGLAGVQIRQMMHTEIFGDQVNVVQARYGGRRVSLLFVGGDGPRRLP